MNKVFKSAWRAFTLMDVLVAVFILGLLAAIVIPQLSNNPSREIQISTDSGIATLTTDDLLLVVQRSGDDKSSVLSPGLWRMHGADKRGYVVFTYGLYVSAILDKRSVDQLGREMKLTVLKRGDAGFEEALKKFERR